MGHVVFWYFLKTGCAGFQLVWMWGLENDSTNDCSTSPLEEQVFGTLYCFFLNKRNFEDRSQIIAHLLDIFAR
jgi:hypothetical protein